MLVQSVLAWGNSGSTKYKSKQKKETKSNKVLEGERSTKIIQIFSSNSTKFSKGQKPNKTKLSQKMKSDL